MSRREMSRFRILRNYGDKSRVKYKDSKSKQEMNKLTEDINQLDPKARHGILDNLSRW